MHCKGFLSINLLQTGSLSIPRLLPWLHSYSPLSIAGKFAELIKGLNPLVDNPLRTCTRLVHSGSEI